MTTTRHPTGQDLVCLICGQQAQDIDHVVNRGMGGSKERDVPENKVPLCRECHDLKTQGYINTEVKWDGGEGRVYRWQRRPYKDNEGSLPWINVPVEVSQRYKCLVLSAAAEEKGDGLGAATRAGVGVTPSAPASSAAAPSAKEEDDERVHGRATHGPSDRVGNRGDSPSVHLTHEQRVAKAQEIKNAEWNRQWDAGDTGNAWIAELGESAEQYLSDFGYVHESLANILRVCAAIPLPLRKYLDLRFSHHVVVADLNREDIEMWLEKCADAGWSVAEFRRQVKGTKPRVKRWTVAELETEAQAFEASDRPQTVNGFLSWITPTG